MVYLRAKTVKGERYLYLVKSVWDAKNSTSRQETIKYLGKESEITKDDIPVDYRNNPKIISYLSSLGGSSAKEREEMLEKLKAQTYRYLIRGDFDAVRNIYKTYSSLSSTASFFEKILTPVMYKVGDMWAKNQIRIADEHVASNVANTLVKMINSEQASIPFKKKIVICVPEGEEHNLGANMLEAHLSSIGHRVYNLTPTEPHDAIAEFVESSKPDSVLVSITLPDNIRPGQRLVKKILERTNVPIFVGGQAIMDNDDTRFDNAQIVHERSLRMLVKIVNQKNDKR